MNSVDSPRLPGTFPADSPLVLVEEALLAQDSRYLERVLPLRLLDLQEQADDETHPEVGLLLLLRRYMFVDLGSPAPRSSYRLAVRSESPVLVTPR